jgi:hypothetical protein
MKQIKGWRCEWAAVAGGPRVEDAGAAAGEAGLDLNRNLYATGVEGLKIFVPSWGIPPM